MRVGCLDGLDLTERPVAPMIVQRVPGRGIMTGELVAQADEARVVFEDGGLSSVRFTVKAPW
jgi:hypothetical protein